MDTTAYAGIELALGGAPNLLTFFGRKLEEWRRKNDKTLIVMRNKVYTKYKHTPRGDKEERRMTAMAAIRSTGRVKKWGNSLGVRIPQTFAENCKLCDGTPVDIFVRDDEIVIRKKKNTLEELLAKVTPENIHGETDWGEPMGREEW